MLRSRHGLVPLCGVLLTLVIFAVPGMAGTMGPVTVPPLVQAALESEAAGQPLQRQTHLKAALQQHPQSELVHWLLGQTRWRDQWRSPKEVFKESLADPVLIEYRARRDAVRATYHEQLQLANWCRKHKLTAQEHAHLTAVLELCKNPDEPGLRARLGHERVGNLWMTRAELESLTQTMAQRERWRREWLPTVRKWSRELAGRNREVRQAARQAVQNAAGQIEALPALEQVFGSGSLIEGRMLVEFLNDIPGTISAQALLRLSLSSRWDRVREDAGQALQRHLPEEFVPGVLITLQTPITMHFAMQASLRGVSSRVVLTNETATRERLLTIASTRGLRILSQPLERLEYAALRGPLQRDRSSVAEIQDHLQRRAREAAQSAAAWKEQVDRVNRDIEQWNARIYVVLEQGTGRQLPATPQAWWEWWRNYNQVSQAQKQKEIVVAEDFRVEEIIVKTEPRKSCLVAGTPVCTDRGMIAVETVRPGDLVLSRHPETGELAWQPVLKTTVRKPEPVLELKTAGGKLQGTAGHHFWVSGQGWRKLRDFKAGQFLHTADGTVAIRSLKPAGTAATYNLVVANFHTYFAGDELLLSHDVTFAKPRDNRVPGLPVSLPAHSAQTP